MVRQQNPFEFPVTGAITWRLCGWFSKDAVSPQNHQPEPSKDICIEPVVNFMVRTLTLWMCCHCLEGEWLEKRNEKAGLRRFRTHSLCFCPQKDVAGGCSISLGSPVCGGLFRNSYTCRVTYNGIGSNGFLFSSKVLLQTDLSSQTLNQPVPIQWFPVLLGKSYFDWWKSNRAESCVD